MVIVLVVLSPACKTTKKNVKTDPIVETTQPPAPEIAVTTDTATSVAPPTDFVQPDAEPAEEPFPTEIDAANKVARDKGYLRDAFFNYDEATLDGDAQAALNASASWLKSAQGSGYGLLIQGHCDERGTEQYNLALGDRRANIARDYLVSLGVDGSRIRTVSYGEERPFEEGHDDTSWAQNRRAHLVLVK
jgi:peptidoglycan-associated lipoprotein